MWSSMNGTYTMCSGTRCCTSIALELIRVLGNNDLNCTGVGRPCNRMANRCGVSRARWSAPRLSPCCLTRPRMRQVAKTADLRGDNFINGKQRALAKIGFLRVRVSIGSRCARGFAVVIGGIVVAAAVDDLSSKPGVQCLRAFRAVNHVELTLRLCADDALFNIEVVYQSSHDSLWRKLLNALYAGRQR